MAENKKKELPSRTESFAMMLNRMGNVIEEKGSKESLEEAGRSVSVFLGSSAQSIIGAERRDEFTMLHGALSQSMNASVFRPLISHLMFLSKDLTQELIRQVKAYRRLELDLEEEAGEEPPSGDTARGRD